MKRYEDFSPSAIRQVRAQFLTPTSPRRSQWRGWNSYVNGPDDREIDWDDIRTVLVVLWTVLPSESIAFSDLLAWPGHGQEWTESERGIAAHSLACYIDEFNEDMWWELDLMLEAIDRLGGAEILEAVGDQAECYLETKERRRLESSAWAKAKLSLGFSVSLSRPPPSSHTPGSLGMRRRHQITRISGRSSDAAPVPRPAPRLDRAVTSPRAFLG